MTVPRSEKAKPQYRKIIKKLPEFEKADRFQFAPDEPGKSREVWLRAKLGREIENKDARGQEPRLLPSCVFCAERV